MVSQTSRYALHVLGYLGARSDEMVRSEELAEATGIPANYLAKILNQLRKAGLVESQKGWRGGFRLRAGAGERPIADVVRIFDGADAIGRRDCAFGLAACSGDDPCPLHDQWETIRGALERMLSGTRIADLASEGGGE